MKTVLENDCDPRCLEVVVFCELLGRIKTKYRGRSGEYFPVGFATAHLEMIREPGRPVSQAGALLAGQDEQGG